VALGSPFERRHEGHRRRARGNATARRYRARWGCGLRGPIDRTVDQDGAFSGGRALPFVVSSADRLAIGLGSTAGLRVLVRVYSPLPLGRLRALISQPWVSWS
jgi:hypothetical protein